ncbi:unnamed protein product [Parnassius mnemosyne]|uniref:AAA+ ATPase domain-containing protein n=1 Tax=Parnassius mnemosyne TaxID=213953 RepID=A0AAV1K9Q2_9NEOP
MVFVLDIDEGIEFDNVDHLSNRLDFGAKAVTNMTSVSRVKINNLRNTLMPIYNEILQVLSDTERSRPGPAIPLQLKSFTVLGRWQLLAQCLGKLSATAYYNDATFRVLLDQIDGLALNYKSSTPVQVIREFLEDSSFSSGGGGSTDSSILTKFSSIPKIGFGNIIGMESVKRDIKFILKKIKAGWSAESSYNRLLLYGPPGTGKTMFAEAIAKELDYLFIKLGNSELADQYVGEGEKKLTNILRAASATQTYPGVFILFDEIDSFTGRGSDVTPAQKSITTTMLQEINDSLTNRVFLCATTNYPRKLDSALLRRFLPGVAVTLPDLDSIRLFVEQRSIFGKLILTAFPDTPQKMYANHFSQDNITRYLSILLDRLANWGSEPNQRYSTTQGLSFTNIYNNKNEITTIYYRDGAGTPLSESNIADNLAAFGVPQNITMAPVVYANLQMLMREVQRVVFVSNLESINDATLPEI